MGERERVEGCKVDLSGRTWVLYVERGDLTRCVDVSPNFPAVVPFVVPLPLDQEFDSPSSEAAVKYPLDFILLFAFDENGRRWWSATSTREGVFDRWR